MISNLPSNVMTTKSRFLLILMCLVWHANPALLLSQSIDYIDGKVINSITYESRFFKTNAGL